MVDTLAFARRLEVAGIERKQAEAHAEAIRDLVVSDLATKADIDRLEARVDRAASDIRRDIEAMSLRLTITHGGIVAVGIGLLAAALPLIIK